MNCSELQDQLLEYAFGTLDEAAAMGVQRHLASGCPACEGQMAEYRATLALLPLALPPAEPPSQGLEKLLKRINPPLSKRPSNDSKFVASRANRFQWIAPALGGGAVAASILLLVGFNIIISKQKSIELLQSKLSDQRAELTQLRTALHASENTQRLIESPAVQVVTLAGTTAQPGAKGRLFWDAANKTVRFSASNLQVLPAGKAYELWLINDAGEKIPAGTMTASEDGSATIDHTFSVPPGMLVATAVTDEPAGGAPQPTGGIQLLGKVN